MTTSRGFTLIEVTVALVIGGLAISAAAALLLALDERAGALAAARVRVDRDANAERLLRHLTDNLILQDSAPTLRGDARHLSFHSWCETPAGWLGRCNVRLTIAPRGDEQTLVLELDGVADQIIKLRTARALVFRYLSDARHRGRWTERWSATVLPHAIAVIGDRDTLLLPLTSQ